MGEIAFSEEQFGRAFAAAYGMATGQKWPAGTATARFVHGPGGIFGACGLEQDVISTRITARGLSQVLKVFPDQKMFPEFPYYMGTREQDDSSEPATECETCISGESQGCLQTACYGLICRETKTLTPNRAIERINAGEFDLQLVNDILGLDDPFQPISNYDRNTILQMATTWAMLEVGILMQARLVPMIWSGNPINNFGTGYAEFPGLDILIGVNKVDKITGVRCQGLDSDVKEFAYNNINLVDAAGNFRIVRVITALESYLYHNADRMGLLPAEWAFCMRPEMWQELSEIWPVAYYTTRNVVLPAGNTNMLDATRLNDLRDDMRGGMYIWVNGRKHQVVTDDGIVEFTNANDANVPQNSFASNIYMVPLAYLGGRPGTFIQHKDYRVAMPDLSQITALASEFWTDAGRFLWTFDRVKWCYTLSGKIEPRVILKVPQIAGRIDHVLITPEQHFRSPFPDSDYFFKGGTSQRSAPSVYSDWNMPNGR